MKKITMTTPLTKKEIKQFWVEDKDVQVRKADLNLERVAAAFASYYGGMPVSGDVESRAFEVARERQIKEKRQAEYDARPKYLRDAVDAKKEMQAAKYNLNALNKKMAELQKEIDEAEEVFAQKNKVHMGYVHGAELVEALQK